MEQPIAKYVIRELYVQLKHYLVAEELVDHLWQNKFISDEDKANISAAGPRHKQVEVLLDSLMTKDNACLEALIQTIENKGNQEFLVKSLQASCERHRKQNLAGEITYTTKSIWFDVREPTPFFTGRIDLLDSLKSQVKSMLRRSSDGEVDIASSYKIFVLHGIGGIGKTELAIKFAHDNFNLFHGNVIWINAEKLSSFADSLQRLTTEFHDVFPFVSNKKTNLNALCKGVYSYFAKKHLPCLIIFDNATPAENTDFDIESFYIFSSSLQPLAIKPIILLTSRDSDWPSRQIQPVQLLKYTTIEALQYMLNTLDDCISENDSKQLSMSLDAASEVESSANKTCTTFELIAEKLECLPLAIAQASATIRENIRKSKALREITYTPSDYLKSLQDEHEGQQLLNDSNFIRQLDKRYNQTTYLTWKVTLNAILASQYGNLALSILHQISYYGSNNIRSIWFNKLLPTYHYHAHAEENKANKKTVGQQRITRKFESTTFCDEALLLLIRYNILTANRGRLNIHRLVQEVIRYNLESNQAEMHGEEIILIEAINLLLQVIRQDHDWEVLPHFTSVWTYGSSYPNFLRQAVQTTSYVLELFRHAGKYIEGFRFAEKVTRKARDAEMATGEGFLKTLLEQGGLYLAAGEADAAMDIFEELLTKYSVDLGNEHPIILATKHNIGALFEEKGNYAQAAELYNSILPFRKKTIGDSHPETLNTKTNLANCYQAEGNNTTALNLYYQILASQDPETPNYLMTQHNIAIALEALNRVQEAEDLLENVVKGRETLLGPGHHHTIESKNNLATLCKKRGAIRRAQDIFQSIIDSGSCKDNNNTTPTILTAKYNLAEVYAHSGNHNKAIELYQQVIASRRRMVDGELPQTIINAKNNLGMILFKENRIDEAMALFISVYETRKCMLGALDLLTLSAQENIASAYSETGKYDDAIAMFTQILELRSHLPGPHTKEFHLRLLTTKFRLAGTLVCKGEHSRALSHYYEVFNARRHETMLGETHIDTLRAKFKYGYALRMTRQHEEANQIYSEVLNVQRSKLEEDHTEILQTMNEMAENLLMMETPDAREKAIRIYTELLDRRTLLLGKFHPKTITTFLQLGSLQRSKEPHLEITLLEEYLNDPLISAKMDVNVVSVKDHLSTLLAEAKEYDRALVHQKEILIYEQANLDKRHRDIFETLYKTLRLLQDKGDSRAAIEQVNYIMKYEQDVLGENTPSPNLQINTYRQGLALENNGNYDDALSMYNKSLALLAHTSDGASLLEHTEIHLSIARLYTKQGNFSKALETFSTIHETANPNDEFRAEHELRTTCGMAKLFYNKGQLDSATECAQQVLLNTSNISNDKTCQYLFFEASVVLADISRENGQFDEAKKVYSEVLESQRKILGPKYPDTISTEFKLNCLEAEVNPSDDIANYEVIFNRFEEIAQTQSSLLGETHPDTLRTNHRKAALLSKSSKLEDLKRAEKLFAAVLELQVIKLGPNHPHTLDTKYDLSIYHQNQRNFVSADFHIRTCLQAWIKIFGENHPKCTEAMARLGELEKIKH